MVYTWVSLRRFKFLRSFSSSSPQLEYQKEKENSSSTFIIRLGIWSFLIELRDPPPIMDTMFFYIHKAVQRRAVGLIGSCEEDKLFISLNLYKSTGRHRVNSSPIILDHIAKIAQADFPVKFSQQQLCDNNDTNSGYEKLICEHLNNIGVREDEHPAILHKIFQVVEAAVSPVDAVVVIVSEVTVSERNAIPASRTAIQGLERVTVIDIDSSSHTSCSICLKDFGQEPITRLPCTHLFHINCIVQWLEVDHLCPLCR